MVVVVEEVVVVVAHRWSGVGGFAEVAERDFCPLSHSLYCLCLPNHHPMMVVVIMPLRRSDAAER